MIDPYKIHLDDQKQTIFLTQKGMELDLGAIAKGYIADRIQDLWKAYGVQAGIINLGGNLLMVGNPPHHQDQKWRIGLRNPFGDDENPIAIITVKVCSAVTSGIYERHLETQGHSFHHILDPKTGYQIRPSKIGGSLNKEKEILFARKSSFKVVKYYLEERSNNKLVPIIEVVENE